MKNVHKTMALLGVALFVLVSFTTTKPASAYKCMIQMINYNGEGAYVTVSLLNPNGDYEKTLYVYGDDEEWYHDITEWWKFHGKRRPNIDAITGATMGGGKRSITVIEIEDDKIDTGYRIRFESAVEDQEYHKKDVEFELTSKSLNSKVEGKGFIRYVRMLPQ